MFYLGRPGVWVGGVLWQKQALLSGLTNCHQGAAMAVHLGALCNSPDVLDRIFCGGQFGLQWAEREGGCRGFFAAAHQPTPYAVKIEQGPFQKVK